MNNFFRIAFLSLILSASAIVFPQQPKWEKIAAPVSITLRNSCFVDSLTGWAAGDSGTIIRTTDGGINWQVQNSTVTTFIIDIFFSDVKNGWALTPNDVFPFNTIILKTTNGGDDWTAEDFQDSTALMRTIFFFDTLHGFIAGSYIAETTDGGITWERAEIDSNFISGYPVYKFKFYSEQFGYASGGVLDNAGVIWRTTNYGKNWSATGVSADQVFDLFIFDSLKAMTLSGDPEGFYEIAKIRTSDSGLSWMSENLPFFGLSFALDFRTDMEGWSASGYKFLFSSDKGETWNEETIPDSAVVYDLQFTDSLTGFAVGEEGAVLKITYPRPEDPLPDRFKFFQNYPNPFNNTTTISWQMPAGEYVVLKIYNSLGQEILILVNEYLPAGNHSVQFKPKPDLPSGVFFFRLQAGSFNETKKMVYLK